MYWKLDDRGVPQSSFCNEFGYANKVLDQVRKSREWQSVMSVRAFRNEVDTYQGVSKPSLALCQLRATLESLEVVTWIMVPGVVED